MEHQQRRDDKRSALERNLLFSAAWSPYFQKRKENEHEKSGFKEYGRQATFYCNFKPILKGMVEGLLKPENKATLVKILTCHVVPAKAMAADVMTMVKADGGEHKVKTVGGCELTLKVDGDKATVTDETGGVANVTIADFGQSNGVIHVIDKVLLPK